MSKRLARNPENEAIRKEVKEMAAEELPQLEQKYTELQQKTSRIHAAFLFDELGRNARQMLCRCLSSTENSYCSAGWEEFGIHLELNPLLIKCIYHNFNLEDPTSYILLAFVQHKDATLSKIIDALKKMGRLDIFNMTYHVISGLADDVLGSYMNNEESGYFSISEASMDNLSDADVGNENHIIRPLCIPSAPFIFQEIGSQSLSYSYIRNKEDDKMQCAIPISNRSSSKVKYGRKVLLTFASDGVHTALQVATEFRKKRENLPHIGVVILNEHSNLVNNSPELFISCCFDQVDYVVPIITENYLKGIVGNDPSLESSVMCMDNKYIKYIYTLMSTYYLNNGCINDKIRCVVPDSMVHLIRHPIMARPHFQVWVRASETDQLSHRILRSRF